MRAKPGPRWSKASGLPSGSTARALSPALIAGLSNSRAWVQVGPPLSASGTEPRGRSGWPRCPPSLPGPRIPTPSPRHPRPPGCIPYSRRYRPHPGRTPECGSPPASVLPSVVELKLMTPPPPSEPAVFPVIVLDWMVRDPRSKRRRPRSPRGLPLSVEFTTVAVAAAKLMLPRRAGCLIAAQRARVQPQRSPRSRWCRPRSPRGCRSAWSSPPSPSPRRS